MATSSSSSRQLPALGRAARPSAAAPRAGKEPQQQRRSRKRDSRQRRHEQERTDEEPEGHDDNEDDDDDEQYNRGRNTEEDEESLLAREEAALIDARFHRAVDIIQSLPKAGPITTTYEEKLMLYSLYKQATEGPVKIPRPGLLDLLGRAKWDAWKKREALSRIQAQEAYVDTLMGILKGFSDRPEAVELINELRNFGLDPDEHTDDYESISSSQRSVSPPSTSRRTYHSAVPSNVEQTSLQGDVTPKRKPTRQAHERTRPQARDYSGRQEETVSERSSDGEERYAEPLRHSYPVQRPSPYHHPAQYPAPVSSQLPPHLPLAYSRSQQQQQGFSSLRPSYPTRQGTAASAVPSLSAFPTDANIDVQSMHSRQSSGAHMNPVQRVTAPYAAGPSASVPTLLPSQGNAASNQQPAITARQANLDRALDSIQTSLTAMHERLSQIENAQTQSYQSASTSSSSSLFANSPVLQLLRVVFNKLLSFLRIRRSSSTTSTSSMSLTSLLSRALVSILVSIRDLSRDAVAVIFLAAAVAAIRNSRGDWRAVIRAWTRILAMASGIGLAREGFLLSGGNV